MKRDAIDFENGKVSYLFRKLLVPTLLGTLAIFAVTAIDGIFIGHGVGAEGVALLIPCFLVLPELMGTAGIWLAMPMAEAVTLLVMCCYCKYFSTNSSGTHLSLS